VVCLKKLFIGHFGDKDKDDWFFSWANDEEDALDTINKIFGKPDFLKELSNASSGGLCFKPIDLSNDDKPYFLLETLPEDFKFINEDDIQKIIVQQKNIPDENLNREKYRNLIEEENIKQKKLEQNAYNKMINKIDNF